MGQNNQILDFEEWHQHEWHQSALIQVIWTTECHVSQYIFLSTLLWSLSLYLEMPIIILTLDTDSCLILMYLAIRDSFSTEADFPTNPILVVLWYFQTPEGISALAWRQWHAKTFKPARGGNVPYINIDGIIFRSPKQG